MNINHHTHPDNLVRYSFLWSEVRLLIAAVALFIGGTPPALKFLPGLSGIVGPLLTLSWIISGVAAGYLLYRWNKNNRMLFGKNDRKDMIYFLVMVVSGFNLGLAGIMGKNIGMTISSNKFIFILVGIIYLFAASYLWRRYKEHGQKIF